MYFVACLSNPCIGGGTCLVLPANPDDFTCLCPPERSGQLCETLDVCKSSSAPCRNSGQCVSTTDGQYQCVCAAGFWGKNCTNFNLCSAPNACENGATCHNVTSSSYTCECQPGYFGDKCQNNNPCLSNPCVNGACQNASTGVGGYRCLCSQGYFGQNCELYNVCWSSPCLNGATCQAVGSNFVCQCASGYQGKICDWNNPCLVTSCGNGGTCINSISGQFECSCVAGKQSSCMKYFEV